MITGMTLWGVRCCFHSPHSSSSSTMLTPTHTLQVVCRERPMNHLGFWLGPLLNSLQLQSSSSGIWAFRRQVFIKVIYNLSLPLPPAALTPSSVSGGRPIAFYRPCFNCRVNIWVRQMQGPGLAADVADVDQEGGGEGDGGRDGLGSQLAGFILCNIPLLCILCIFNIIS